MNVLLVSISAPPKNSPESLQTGRYLKFLSRQHEVTLLTTSAVGGWEPQDEGIAKYLKDVHQRIELWSLHPKIVSLLKKLLPSILVPDESIFFFWQMKRALRKITTRPDVILSRSLPFSSAIMALKLSSHWNVPWIMHLSDFWVDSPFASFSDEMLKKQLVWEKRCISTADAITLTSRKMIHFYQDKYQQFSHKFHFLPNVFDEDDMNENPLVFEGKMKIVFTGRLYGSRTVKEFVDCMEDAISLHPELEKFIEVKLAGFFDDDNILRIKSSPLSCIHYIGPLSYNEAMALQQNAHILLIIDSQDDDSRFEMFFPSKLLDYMIAQRFILAFTRKNSTSYEVVEGSLGRCFFKENSKEFPEFLSNAVSKFLERNNSFFSRRLDQNNEYADSYNANRLNELIGRTLKSKN